MNWKVDCDDSGGSNKVGRWLRDGPTNKGPVKTGVKTGVKTLVRGDGRQPA